MLWCVQFPFDCQDLSCIIKERGRRGRAIFLPNLRNPQFASMDTSIQLQEWSLDGMTIDMKQPMEKGSQNGELVINVKLSRYWLPVILQQLLVIFLSSILSIVGFFIEVEEGPGDRMAYTLTLLLTVVLFDTGAEQTSYLTFMDKYTLTTYAYLTMMLVENAVESMIDPDGIAYIILHVVAVVLFVLYNAVFVWYAWRVRSKELRKLTMGYCEVHEILPSSEQNLKMGHADGRHYEGNEGRTALIFGALVER